MVSTSTVGTFRYERTGEIVTILCDTTIREFRPINGPKSVTKGAKSYRTDSGIELNSASTDESQFATLDGDVLVRVE